MTIKAQVSPDDDVLRVRVCVRCGTRASEAMLQAEPVCSDDGLVGPHRFEDRPACLTCGGRGWVPFGGRWLSRDPRDWDRCDDCEGSGAQGLGG